MDDVHAEMVENDVGRGDSPLVGPDGQLYALLPDYLRAWTPVLHSLWYAEEREAYKAAKGSGAQADLSALLAERALWASHHCRQDGYLSFRAWREGGYRAGEWVEELDGEGVPEPY